MKILVTGGAGYIGSFMTKALIERGYEVVVFDSLERGHKESVDNKANLIVGDIRKEEDLNNLFSSNNFDAVMHFAGLISVAESEEKPEIYTETNIKGSENLFKTAVNRGINKFIFSSTAAIYGNPEYIPITEDHPKNPTSKYGKTKLITENLLSSLREGDSQLSFVCLRYFNACGASIDGSMGEDHNPETHIIPLAIKAAMSGSKFKLFGTDYNTPDGTCIRDYIHVLDLVEAHVLALEKITKDGGGHFYNIGTGRGYSNKEVIEAVKKVSGKDIEIEEVERRAGDSSQLVADPSKINNELGFFPKYSALDTIVETAWTWHTKNS